MKIQTSTSLIPGIIIGSMIFIMSCGSNMESRESYQERKSTVSLADSISPAIHKTAPDVMVNDTAHAFIRKADIRCRVKDVRNSTTRIEDIVRAHKGYVIYTNLESKVYDTRSIRLSADTVANISNYRVENNMTLRVPNEELDATLNEISGQFEFLDHRKVSADDVKFKLMANKLSEARYKYHKTRVQSAIQTQGKKLNQTTEAEDDLLVKQETADNTRIETLELLDEVNFSTVTMNLYQTETQKVDHIAYIEPLKPYEPGFGSKFLSALADGSKAFGEIILFLIRIWPVFLIIGAILILVRWLLKQKWAS